mmetsp:Transcript_115594/g.258247  ORF Transcript_115594/g.258247 Transcript_115594/m.258247 type:complete len:593 (-) Transcript_115594:39-1817(-)
MADASARAAHMGGGHEQGLSRAAAASGAYVGSGRPIDHGARGRGGLEASSAESSTMSSSSEVMERAKLLNQEDLERTPDVPEDPDHTPFTLHHPSRGSEGKGVFSALKLRQCWWCSAGGAAAIVLVLAFSTLIHLGSTPSGHLKFPFGVPLPGSAAGGAAVGAGGVRHGSIKLPRGKSSGGRGGHQKQRKAIIRQGGLGPAREVCNASAPLPESELRTWELQAGWRRACQVRNEGENYPLERNWCWIGVKAQCHGNLKSHISWSDFQGMAAKEGTAPNVSDEPFHPLQHPEVCDRPSSGAVRRFTAEENVTAREWFKNNVAVYVLNLPTDTERWEMISARLTALDIWATRVPGVDMRVPGAMSTARYMGWIPRKFNFTRAQEIAYTHQQQMGSILGTVGCASAHFKVQSKVIADGAPLAIVFEDDSWPVEDFITRLWSMVHEELPCDWDVLALLSRCPYGKCISQHLTRVQPDANEPAWRCRQGVNWGMHAILYRTDRLAKVQEAWKQTVFDEKRPHCMDVDVALASISDRVGFYAVPAVQDPGFVTETNHPSARWDINQEALTTSTRTTTSFVYVPTLKPGEPWPGAWNFG